jgi:hypothetical protein
MSKKFLTLVNITNGTSFPASPTAGDLFFRTDLSIMYVYSGTEWISMGAGAIESVDGGGPSTFL